MNTKKEITSCYHSCPFFGTSMDGMECNHPYFEDKGAFENMIITQENSRDTFPEKCPLKKEQLVITRDKECIHLFTLGIDGYHSVVCKKCGLSFGFENRRPRNIDAQNNSYDYDRFYTFSEYYDMKKENEELKRKLAASDNSNYTKCPACRKIYLKSEVQLHTGLCGYCNPPF